MRRLAITKTLGLFILVMWIVSLYTCILIITYTLSNPLTNNQQGTSDSTDEFYKEMQYTLDKLLNHSKQGVKRLSRHDSERKPEMDETTSEPIQRIETNPVLEMSPLYKCDKYEEKSRSCVHVRQIGTTLTLGVQLAQSSVKQVHYRIRWFRYYKQREEKEELKIEFTKKNSPWNINIGGGSTELRISPLTEIDFSYNYFEARIDDIHSQDTENILRQKTKRAKTSGNLSPIKFVIETINIDMGSLYPGEELTIYARAFIELPLRSVTLEWSMEDSDFNDLPSNMRVIGDGSSVVVNELRAKKDRVLICSVYSNKGIFVARRNFLFRKIGRVNKQDLVHFTPEVNFKRRKKRDTEENPGTEQYDYEIRDLRPQGVSIQEQYKRLKNPSEEYSKNKKRIIDQPDSDYTKKDQYQEYSFDQSSDNMAINNKFFYRDENKLKPYDESSNTRQSTQKDMFSPQRLTLHRSKIPINSNHQLSRFHGNPRNGLRAHRKSGDAIQEENSDDEFPNNDGDNAEFLEKKIRYDSRRAAEVDHSGRRNWYRSLEEDIQRANRMVETPEDNNPNSEEHVDEKDNNRYTFDDRESMLIAECTQDQDCNNHATCLKNAAGKSFCKCISHYKGNGIFCWLV